MMRAIEPCPNCSSTNHRRCCARCGRSELNVALAAGSDFCSAACADEQAREDKISQTMEKEATARKRKTPWTKKRLRAVINAVTAIMAGEEGEGDWNPENSTSDMEAGLRRLQEELEAMKARS